MAADHVLTAKSIVYCCITLLMLLTAHLFVMMCLLGKVHGSLARAGKVKGQTPKVLCFLSKFLLCTVHCTCSGYRQSSTTIWFLVGLTF